MTSTLSDQQLIEQLPYTITETSYDQFGEKIKGKVRDSYVNGDTRILVTTDRLSCFDRVVTSIPLKGQVLNQLAVEWFSITSDIVANHLKEVPHPNVMVSHNCEVLPVEVVVRGYLAGSAWRDYEAGRPVSGVQLPEGLSASQKLPEPILTPSTKAEVGDHDEPISEQDLLARGLVAPELWQQIREVALALFQRGQEFVAARGLILADTKYEFGLYQGKLVLVDEIHTLDSSRYWIAETYADRLAKGEAPEMLDKEPTRQWLLSQGFQGDGPIPDFSDEHRIAIARHYIDSYELVLGKAFIPGLGDTSAAIQASLEQIAL